MPERADGEAVVCRRLRDEGYHRGELTSRDGDVLEDRRRATTGERREGVPARSRQARRLGVVFGRAHLTGSVGGGDLGHARGLIGDGRRMAVGLHQEHGLAVGGQADMRVVLDAMRGRAIEKLERARDDSRRDDGRDRFGGVLDPIVERQHRAARAAGLGTSFSSTSVMMPSVPSDPMKRSFSEYPATSLTHASLYRDPAVGQDDTSRLIT